MLCNILGLATNFGGLLQNKKEIKICFYQSPQGCAKEGASCPKKAG
jgi:hypothetical protein